MPSFHASPLPSAGDVDVTDVTFAGRHGAVHARGYRGATSVAADALIWVHGGGFIAGDLEMPEAHWVGIELARRSIPVLSVEYRKCLDGVHYPVPSDDVLDAWLWLTEQAEELGVVSGHLHLGGASAGANLAAGVTKRLRDGAGPTPASLVLVYPLLHAELPSLGEDLRKALDESGEDLFTPGVVRALTVNFAGGDAVLEDVYAFPANGDVSGQPPVYILNSEADSLRASGERYGEQLAAAGVTVSVEFEPGSRHGHLNDPHDPAALRSIERLAAWLGREERADA